jgi:hypothetical protein
VKDGAGAWSASFGKRLENSFAARRRVDEKETSARVALDTQRDAALLCRRVVTIRRSISVDVHST